MLMTKRKPATAGEILTEELMLTLCLAQAEAICVQSEHVNELCNNR
jgi:plasmid maintenance system antidote protein VapI